MCVKKADTPPFLLTFVLPVTLIARHYTAPIMGELKKLSKMMKGKRERQAIKNATWKTKAEMQQEEKDAEDKAAAREANQYQEQRRDKYGRIIQGQARIVPVQTNSWGEGCAAGVSKKVSKDRRKKQEPWEVAKRQRAQDEKDDQKQRELAAADAIAAQLEKEQSSGRGRREGQEGKKRKKEDEESDGEGEEGSWRHGRKAKKKKVVDRREYRPGLPNKPDEEVVCKRRFWTTELTEENIQKERHEGDVYRAALDIVVLEGIQRCPPPVKGWDDPRCCLVVCPVCVRVCVCVYGGWCAETIPLTICRINHRRLPPIVGECMAQQARLSKTQQMWKPSTVQAQCWPAICSGYDVLALAETGSGKTLGYLLPVRRAHPCSVVVSVVVAKWMECPLSALPCVSCCVRV